ncbi:hypothetical protein [Pararhodospirillum photometricum]|uniref:Uncharacterized protein n=1 Tax=Pararhodospirillum photometricum DSM 122 TaxID=1150469 RepID=H6SKB0_PARPM|nr:hypothetical protein [Pararhodospirillum photometricum]CCG08425.1 unnamed protein product [Pararhodospirillum photometricum DSM 122]
MSIVFVVPAAGWTFTSVVDLTLPSGEVQSLPITYRALPPRQYADLLEANVRGDLPNPDLVRSIVTAWGAQDEAGAPLSLNDERATAALEHVWVAGPVLAEYQTALSRAMRKNSQTSAEPGPEPATPPALSATESGTVSGETLPH